jgi:alpha-L-rhamnosidase
MRKFTRRLTLVFAALTWQLHAATPALSVDNLTCEYLVNPRGLDTPHPRLSWQLQSPQRGQKETGYQVLVASTRENLAANLGDLWDTGRVDSDQSIQLDYQGRPLPSQQSCFWKVRVWDKDGKPSRYSEPASWEMGLLQPNDWHGQWIARDTDTNAAIAPLLRRAFNLDGKIARARLFICGLGYYELHLNGKKIGDHLLDPGFTRYDKRALYVTYDVTDALKQGSNAVGVILGNGWYNLQTRAFWNFDNAPWRSAPKLLMELRIQFTDGRNAIVATDRRWKAGGSPVTYNSIYSGESYDARREQPGWDTANFDDSRWSPAQIVSPPRGQLAAQAMPPITIGRPLYPVSVRQPKPGVYVYDFGQDLSGFAQLTLSGPAGTAVTLKYGERLAADGTVDQKEIAKFIVELDPNQEFQTDHYILGGHGPETWHARFAYHGFQYVEVTGAPGPLGPGNLTACFVHSDVPVAGRFDSSDPLLNRIWYAARWSYLSNLEGVPTDSPHREKNGWTGDAHLAAEQGLFNYNAVPLYEKWINDIADEQNPNSEVPGIVPTSGWGYQWGNGPAWDSAFLIIPWYLYEYTGDTRVLTAHYQSMREYVDLLARKSRDNIIDWGRNDWAPAKTDTPADITSTAYYYQDALIVAKIAALLGYTDDVGKYQTIAVGIRHAFNERFFHPDTASYGNGSQTSLSCALYQGLVEPGHRSAVFTNLVAAIRQNDNHIDTGILGAKYLLSTLTDNGRADLAYQVATQPTQPGWGWWMANGATTLWEKWDGSESRNHIVFGDISAWFYKALAGMNPDPLHPAFKHTIFLPHPVGPLQWVKASHQSMYGPIQCGWSITPGQFNYQITIPPNSTATVFLPTSNPGPILESGHPAVVGKNGITSLTPARDWTTVEIQSGSYSFISPWSPTPANPPVSSWP